MPTDHLTKLFSYIWTVPDVHETTVWDYTFTLNIISLNLHITVVTWKVVERVLEENSSHICKQNVVSQLQSRLHNV